MKFTIITLLLATVVAAAPAPVDEAKAEHLDARVSQRPCTTHLSILY